MGPEEVERRLVAEGLVPTFRKELPNRTGDQLGFETGEIVSVYRSGSVVPQGKNQDRVREILGLGGNGEAESVSESAPSRQVFVVYGHDGDARTQLEAMLRRWKLDPLILDQLPSEGQTVIEKLEKYADGDVSFAVVLSTPDDEGHVRDKPDEKKFRARQNVILELGLMLAKLGRPRVAILVKRQEEMERPSDIQGLIYLPFSDNVEETGVLLAKEMEKQGIPIEMARL